MVTASDMHLTKERLTPLSAGTDKVRALYEEAFPENERIRWEHLLTDLNNVDFYAYYDEDRFVGLTYAYRKGNIVWWFYFAVCKELRGKGYGTEIIQQIVQQYKDDVLMLDIEDPKQVADNSAQRNQRYNFYKRMGFDDTEAAKTFDDLRMIILSKGGNISQANYEMMLDEIWKVYFLNKVK